MSVIINIELGINRYKVAKCICGKKLIKGDEVVIVTKATGSFNSSSSYHIACAKPIVEEAHEEAKKLLAQLIIVSQKIDVLESKSLH